MGKMLFLVWTVVLGVRSTDGLDDTTIMVHAKYSLNITRTRKKIYLSLHYNAANSFLYPNGRLKIHQFKAKDSDIKPYALCLGNNSKGFTVNNMKKLGLRDSSSIFSIGYVTINVSDIINIHKYLMKKHNIV